MEIGVQVGAEIGQRSRDAGSPREEPLEQAHQIVGAEVGLAIEENARRRAEVHLWGRGGKQRGIREEYEATEGNPKQPEATRSNPKPRGQARGSQTWSSSMAANGAPQRSMALDGA